uniref:Uncharacterized protein n=1 Tax=Anguilla anguilla TaxID=7936 RepID=A0A0E9VY15_ANGAN
MEVTVKVHSQNEDLLCCCSCADDGQHCFCLIDMTVRINVW